jgi:hypothetical protein
MGRECGRARRRLLLESAYSVCGIRKPIRAPNIENRTPIQSGRMAPSSRRIEFLARAIVNRLEDRGLIEFHDAEAGLHVVVRTLEENFRRIEAEDATADRS